MGATASNLYRPFFSPKQCKALICGIDAVGKTSILYKLKSPEDVVVVTIPTIGFNVETVKINTFEFTAWDVGGRAKIRPFWRHYYEGMDAMIFVVDSNDLDRIDQARDEFHRMLNEDLLQGIPILLFCNKQDLPNALSPDQIANIMGVSNGKICIREDVRMIIVQGCSVVEGYSGVREGLDKLSGALEETHVTDDQYGQDGVEKRIVPASSKTTFLEYKASNLTLERFADIKNSTECPFAKAAKLCGGKAFIKKITIKEQAKANVEALIEFTCRSNAGEKLDGFCIDVDDERARTGSPEEFGECVRTMLTALGDMDPSVENMMGVSYIGSRGWRFRFNRTDFFITTFAPCYPETSSRYAFGSDRAFLLLQPELSFFRHDLPADTAQTKWENPENVRDATRVAFRDAGRGYYIPENTTYPMAEHIVKPLEDDGVSVVRWWIAPDSRKERH
jgi:small GTP-binding protein